MKNILIGGPGITVKIHSDKEIDGYSCNLIIREVACAINADEDDFTVTDIDNIKVIYANPNSN